jgi:gluconokinase
MPSWHHARVPDTTASRPVPRAPRTIVVMGVTGAGKTTVGRLVATALDLPFRDADDFHDPAAIDAMRRGIALTEQQRAPWIDRLHAELTAHAPGGVVLAASVLTAAARSRLTHGLGHVDWVLLTGAPATIEARVAARVGHFAGPELVTSQFATLEIPNDAIVLDVTDAAEVVAGRAIAALQGA